MNLERNDIKQFNRIVSQEKAYFVSIINNRYKQWAGSLPVEIEDIFNEFISTIPKILKEFDKNLGVPLRVYIGLRCNWFTRKYISKWTTEKHKVLSYSNNDKYEYVPDYENVPKVELNGVNEYVNELNETQLVIYNNYFFEDMRISDLVKALNSKLSRYQIKREIELMKSKLKKILELHF